MSTPWLQETNARRVIDYCPPVNFRKVQNEHQSSSCSFLKRRRKIRSLEPPSFTFIFRFAHHFGSTSLFNRKNFALLNGVADVNDYSRSGYLAEHSLQTTLITYENDSPCYSSFFFFQWLTLLSRQQQFGLLPGIEHHFDNKLKVGLVGDVRTNSNGSNYVNSFTILLVAFITLISDVPFVDLIKFYRRQTSVLNCNDGSFEVLTVGVIPFASHLPLHNRLT